jgi:hypothetical protein
MADSMEKFKLRDKESHETGEEQSQENAHHSLFCWITGHTAGLGW